jgi:hypothetical protein
MADLDEQLMRPDAAAGEPAPGPAAPDGGDGDFGLEFEEDGAAPFGGDADEPAFEPEQSVGILADEPDAADAVPVLTGRSGPELSDADLALVLGWADASAPWVASLDEPEKRRNRRAGTRHAVSARATVRRAGDDGPGVAADGPETVQLRNVAPGGVCALHATAMRPGDTFWLTLRSADARALARTIDRRCTVVRCEPGGTGRALYNVAARFVA